MQRCRFQQQQQLCNVYSECENGSGVARWIFSVMRPEGWVPVAHGGGRTRGEAGTARSLGSKSELGHQNDGD
ncbi:unnamed protein product [Lampetra fluviatilis]